MLPTSWEDVSRSSLGIVGNVNRDIKTSPISPAGLLNPTSGTEVEKLLLISSLRSLDSIREERRGGQSGVVIRVGRDPAGLQRTDLPAVEKSETSKELRCSHDRQ